MNEEFPEENIGEPNDSQSLSSMPIEGQGGASEENGQTFQAEAVHDEEDTDINGGQQDTEEVVPAVNPVEAQSEQDSDEPATEYAKIMREKGEELAQREAQEYQRAQERYKDLQEEIIGKVMAVAEGLIPTSPDKPLELLRLNHQSAVYLDAAKGYSRDRLVEEQLHELIYAIMGAQEEMPGDLYTGLGDKWQNANQTSTWGRLVRGTRSEYFEAVTSGNNGVNIVERAVKAPDHYSRDKHHLEPYFVGIYKSTSPEV